MTATDVLIRETVWNWYCRAEAYQAIEDALDLMRGKVLAPADTVLAVLKKQHPDPAFKAMVDAKIERIRSFGIPHEW